MTSHKADEPSNDVGSLFDKVVGESPRAVVKIGRNDLHCLLDTGGQVSTITETYFKQYLLSEGELLDVSSFIHISGAQGLSVPFLGYLEVDLVALGYTFPKMGFLIVKDPVNTPLEERKREVPGVIGSNIFNHIVKTLGAEEGSEFLKQLVRSGETNWCKALALFSETAAHKIVNSVIGRVRIKSEGPVVVPARSVKVLTGSVKPSAKDCVYHAMVESHEMSCPLPKGLVLGCSYVTVGMSGLVPIQMTNFSDSDVYVQPRTSVGVVSLACPQSNVELREVSVCEVIAQEKNSVSSVKDQIISKMDIGESISNSQRKAFEDLVVKHSSTFSLSDYDIGYCDRVQHRIITIDDIPVKVPHRRVPPHQWPEVREYLTSALDRGIIRESSSPYASPVVLVRKQDGSLRLCVDYRALNLKTHKDAYPLPRIDEALQALKGARYFCSLDLAHGFNQVPVASEDIEKTAFRVGTGGLYEYLRMPFGLCNAPATFMRLMDGVFGDMNFQSVLIYLDDILVFGATMEETLERLDKVLTRLSVANLKAKPSKCHMFKDSLRYLGHVICKDGISPDPEKTKAVREWKIPKTETELRGFLGLTGYYRSFVSGYAKIATPLHALLHKDESGKARKRARQINWNPEADQAFERLKDILCSAPLLGHPDFTLPFILEVDASHLGLGAVLSQRHGKKSVVISYASRGLRQSERNLNNYSSMKLELLGLKWAITEKFRDILIGAKFCVYTDNNPLSYLQTSKKLGAIESRWAADLALFDFTIKYRSGKANGNADALSRKTEHSENPKHFRLDELYANASKEKNNSTAFPREVRDAFEDACSQVWINEIRVRTSSTAPLATSTLPALPSDQLSALQNSDPFIGRLRFFWNKDQRPTARQLGKECKEVRKLILSWDKLADIDGILYRKILEHGKEIKQLLLPQSLQTDVLKALHDDAGHQGFERTLQLTRKRCFWPCMTHDIEDYCRSCVRCTTAKAGRRSRQAWDH